MNAEDYIPFGPEWEKELMKWNKKHLIAHLRRTLIGMTSDPWISTKDRLPVAEDLDADYLTWGGEYVVTLGFSSKGKWYSGDPFIDEHFDQSKVTHWMPLPAPPSILGESGTTTEDKQ